ncbi:MAG: hypothetical protein ACOYVK_13770 [Bacillota bacterium]
MENATISITFNGHVDDDNNKWIEWYNEGKKIISLFGYEPNHIGITSTSLKSGKVMTLKRNEKKLVNAIENGDVVKSISIFSLEDNYKSASFDYNVLLVRNSDYVTLIVNKSDFYKVDEDVLGDSLRKYINATYAEIYEMDRYEFPLIYATKANPATSFKTLKIIKKIK